MIALAHHAHHATQAVPWWGWLLLGIEVLVVGLIALTLIAGIIKKGRRRGSHRRTRAHLDRARARIRAGLPAGIRTRLEARASARTGWRALNAIARAGAGLGVPVEGRDEPIRAWRGINVRPTSGGYELHPLFQAKGPIPLDATASCYLGHRAPTPSCYCGFYAVKDPADAVGWNATCLAEVELFGLVVEHELGYRAERQRILSLELSAYSPFDPHDVANALGVEVTKVKRAGWQTTVLGAAADALLKKPKP